MKKLLLAFVAFFAFAISAFAAVDINAASKEELEAVNGIGPAKAQAIIEYRKKNGPFARVDDLKKVKGFGDKNVDKMRSELTVGGGTAKAEAKQEESRGDAKGADKKADKKNDKKDKKDNADKK